MSANGIRPTLFYFNPNIFPAEEYIIRKSECSRYAAKLGLEIIDGDYDYPGWLNSISGLENEPERGARCLQCFKIRLIATAKLASERGIGRFATTLASSRWKNLEQISQAGRWAESFYPSTSFYDRNWRKDGLDARRRILLRENGFYNQTYCGCQFSLRERKDE
jgi:predicted adenine nucleotide alpha hydrolase (AANH) superfamily ATPase